MNDTCGNKKCTFAHLTREQVDNDPNRTFCHHYSTSPYQSETHNALDCCLKAAQTGKKLTCNKCLYGDCFKGETCPYIHNKEERHRRSSENKLTCCFEFSEKGECKRVNCTFFHRLETKPKKSEPEPEPEPKLSEQKSFQKSIALFPLPSGDILVPTVCNKTIDVGVWEKNLQISDDPVELPAKKSAPYPTRKRNRKNNEKVEVDEEEVMKLRGNILVEYIFARPEPKKDKYSMKKTQPLIKQQSPKRNTEDTISFDHVITEIYDNVVMESSNDNDIKPVMTKSSNDIQPVITKTNKKKPSKIPLKERKAIEKKKKKEEKQLRKQCSDSDSDSDSEVDEDSDSDSDEDSLRS